MGHSPKAFYNAMQSAGILRRRSMSHVWHKINLEIFLQMESFF